MSSYESLFTGDWVLKEELRKGKDWVNLLRVKALRALSFNVSLRFGIHILCMTVLIWAPICSRQNDFQLGTHGTGLQAGAHQHFAFIQKPDLSCD